MGFGSPLFSFASVKRGLEASLPSSCQQGALYSAYDEPALYIGNELNSFEDIVCRNKALNRSVAGLYVCQTLLHENHPAGIEEYVASQVTSYTGTTGVSSGGRYTNQPSPYRMRTTSGLLTGENARIVVPYAFPAGGNLTEASFTVHSITLGDGDGWVFAGLKNSFADFQYGTSVNYAGFYHKRGETSKCGIDSGGHRREWDVNALLGRNIQQDDTVTVRLFRLEGSIAIDSVSFYVNGRRIATMRGTALSYIPDVPLYSGFGAYSYGVSTPYNMDIRCFRTRVIA